MGDGSSDGHGQKDKSLVEHHCEDDLNALVILKLRAEAMFWTGEYKEIEAPFYNFSQRVGDQ
jgi:hypothetical protein